MHVRKTVTGEPTQLEQPPGVIDTSGMEAADRPRPARSLLETGDGDASGCGDRNDDAQGAFVPNRPTPWAGLGSRGADPAHPVAIGPGGGVLSVVRQGLGSMAETRGVRALWEQALRFRYGG